MTQLPKYFMLIFVLILTVMLQAGAQTPVLNIEHSPASVEMYEKLEITFDLGHTYDNPYDADEVEVWLEFVTPSQEHKTIPAFWFEEYTRGLEGATERFYPTFRNTWMARIVGEEPGTHAYRVVVIDVHGSGASDWKNFECVWSGNRGFVRVDSRDPNFMVFDNGEMYFPRGFNLCWGGGRGGYNVIQWQEKLAENGGNWARYWISFHTAYQPLEWIREQGNFWHGLGRYSQQIACRFDAMLDDASQRGIYVQLCMDSFNAWNHAYYANWVDNPYNVQRGGMLNAPHEYFTNAQAKSLARNRFRYIVARWAYNTSVLCWEFFNEIDIMGAGGDPSGYFVNNLEQGGTWHQEMAQYIRSIDPFNHLCTTSFSNQTSLLRYPEIWSLPEMDIVQVHLYSNDSPDSHLALVAQGRAYHKPVVLGEWGLESFPQLRSEKSDNIQDTSMDEVPEPPAHIFYTDPDGQTLHDAIWPVAMAGSGAMSWWWDNWIDPGNFYHHFKPLSDYLEGEDWAAYHLTLDKITYQVNSSHQVSVRGSQGLDHAFFWVRDRSGAHTTAGLEMTSWGYTDGEKTIEYWNTYTGDIVRSYIQMPSAGALSFAFPDFNKDMAVKVKGVTGSPSPTPTTPPVWRVTPACSPTAVGECRVHSADHAGN